MAYSKLQEEPRFAVKGRDLVDVTWRHLSLH
jgi:hypothetical protein